MRAEEGALDTSAGNRERGGGPYNRRRGSRHLAEKKVQAWRPDPAGGTPVGAEVQLNVAGCLEVGLILMGVYAIAFIPQG